MAAATHSTSSPTPTVFGSQLNEGSTGSSTSTVVATKVQLGPLQTSSEIRLTPGVLNVVANSSREPLLGLPGADRANELTVPVAFARQATARPTGAGLGLQSRASTVGAGGGVAVAVMVGVAVSVGVSVGVGVRVAVGVGVGVPSGLGLCSISMVLEPVPQWISTSTLPSLS